MARGGGDEPKQMQGLAVITALVLTGFGYGSVGLLGALTGLVVAVAVGSGILIVLAVIAFWSYVTLLWDTKKAFKVQDIWSKRRKKRKSGSSRRH